MSQFLIEGGKVRRESAVVPNRASRRGGRQCLPVPSRGLGAALACEPPCLTQHCTPHAAPSPRTANQDTSIKGKRAHAVCFILTVMCLLQETLLSLQPKDDLLIFCYISIQSFGRQIQDALSLVLVYCWWTYATLFPKCFRDTQKYSPAQCESKP